MNLKAAILFLLSLPTAAIAAGQATLEADGNNGKTILKISWQDPETLRLEPENHKSSYFIARNGKAYSVTTRNGKPMVLDMTAMTGMMRGFSSKTRKKTGTSTFDRSGSFTPTGASETVAGIKGHVYRMHWIDKQGKERNDEVVLTDNPTVVEMTKAYLGSISTMFGHTNSKRLLSQMPDDDRGILRMGEQFHVRSISNKSAPATAFELPAKPMTMQQLMHGLR